MPFTANLREITFPLRSRGLFLNFTLSPLFRLFRSLNRKLPEWTYSRYFILLCYLKIMVFLTKSTFRSVLGLTLTVVHIL